MDMVTTGKDKKDGAIYKNVYFTNTLGPALVMNPKLTKYLLSKACKNNIGISDEKNKLKKEFEIEEKSLESHKEFLDIKMYKSKEEQQKIFKFK